VQFGDKGRSVGNIKIAELVNGADSDQLVVAHISLIAFLFPKIISGFVSEKLLLCYNLSFTFDTYTLCII
jgi:tRNA-binding EMAP/Myf-like protein